MGKSIKIVYIEDQASRNGTYTISSKLSFMAKPREVILYYSSYFSYIEYPETSDGKVEVLIRCQGRYVNYKTGSLLRTHTLVL